MKNKKNDVALFFISIACFLVMSCSIVIMYPGYFPDYDNNLIIICGSMFWGFAVIGLIMQIILVARRRKWYSEMHLLNDRRFNGSNNGVFTFFRNIPAIIVDVLFFISFISFIVVFVFTDGLSYACYILLSVVCFTFCMHCVFDGRVFHYISNRDRIINITDKEHAVRAKKERK